jgi:CarD family transcriptional regulator
VTKDREISRVLSYLSYGECPIHPDWKVRYKENTEKMQSGSLLQAAQVFKALLLLHADRALSFREKKMLERAQHMLVSEISLARGVPGVHATNLLERAVARAELKLLPPT